jgi:hypothetical protein
MIDPFATALAALHASAGAVAAIYTPVDGEPFPIRLIRGQPSEFADHNGGQIILDTDRVQIMRSDVAEPLKDDLVEIGTEIFVVQGGATLDVEGVTWNCSLEPA